MFASVERIERHLGIEPRTGSGCVTCVEEHTTTTGATAGPREQSVRAGPDRHRPSGVPLQPPTSSVLDSEAEQGGVLPGDGAGPGRGSSFDQEPNHRRDEDHGSRVWPRVTS